MQSCNPLPLLVAAVLICFTQVVRGAANCPTKCRCNETVIRCVEKELTVVPDFKKVLKTPFAIDLSGNDIEEIKIANFFSAKLRMVQFLHLNDNSILDIEVTAFSALPELYYLDLSNNLIEDIPSHVIERNTKLEELNLSGNLFSSKTPELISKSLRILDLSFSKLSVFTENSLKGLPSLRALHLQANSLKHVDYNIFVDVQLVHVDLSYNCWKCNCDTIKLFDYLVKAGLTEIDRPIQCMHPNKWYEDIYNSKGPMHHDRLCKRKLHKTHHNDASGKPEVDHKVHSPESVVNHVPNSNEPEKDLEPETFTFGMRYVFIIAGVVIVVVLAVVSTILLRIVIKKSKQPKHHIYEELMENGTIHSKLVSEDVFLPSTKIHCKA